MPGDPVVGRQVCFLRIRCQFPESGDMSINDRHTHMSLCILIRVISALSLQLSSFNMTPLKLNINRLHKILNSLCLGTLATLEPICMEHQCLKLSESSQDQNRLDD